MLIRLGVQESFHIGEISEIAVARRAGVALAQRIGFDETHTGQLALIITEASTNIAKHAGEGEILIRSLQYENNVGVEVIALDSGPGISNIDLQMQDGHSSTGTYGVGLGAINRLSQQFNIYTIKQQGTVVQMVIWNNNQIVEPEWQIGTVCLPLPGEQACGDGWNIEFTPKGILTLMVADGLGHGPDAAIASNAAIDIINDCKEQFPATLLERTHLALRSTRGAAVAIAQIDSDNNRLRFAGIGNIAAYVFEASARRHLISHNGIVGSNVRKIQEIMQPWNTGSVLIAHSDGISARWDLNHYPQLIDAHPSLIAAVIYRDFARGRDDSSIVVIRQH